MIHYNVYLYNYFAKTEVDNFMQVVLDNLRHFFLCGKTTFKKQFTQQYHNIKQKIVSTATHKVKVPRDESSHKSAVEPLMEHACKPGVKGIQRECRDS